MKKVALHKERTNHDQYLEALIGNLHLIGEDRNSIQWIMKDGVWKKEGEANHYKLCDLLIGYYDGHAMPIELKGSKKNVKDQLESGKRFLEEVLNYEVYFGKLVIYKNRSYETHIYDFEQDKYFNLFTFNKKKGIFE